MLNFLAINRIIKVPSYKKNRKSKHVLICCRMLMIKIECGNYNKKKQPKLILWYNNFDVDVRRDFQDIFIKVNISLKYNS